MLYSEEELDEKDLDTHYENGQVVQVSTIYGKNLETSENIS